MGFGLDLKISGMCRPVDLRWQSSSFCMWQTALSSSHLTPDLRQKGVSFAWNGRVGYRTWRFCSWLSGSPLGCEGPLPWRNLLWKLSKSPLLYIKVDFFQQCKGLKKTCPFCQLYVVTSTTSMESCWCQLLTEICKCSWISCAISRQYLRSTLHQVLWCIQFSCCCCVLKRL